MLPKEVDRNSPTPTRNVGFLGHDSSSLLKDHLESTLMYQEVSLHCLNGSFAHALL